MRVTARFLAAALVSVSAFLGSLLAADWPGFRGSRGGVADDKDLPVQWSKDNILWKLKLPGPGASSPITTGDKLIVTYYSGYGLTEGKGFGGGGGFGKGKFGKGGFGKGKFGKGGFGKGGFGGGADTGDQKKLRLHVLCVDRKKGEILWQKEIKPNLPETPHTGMMREHGYASSTPVTDGKNVYVFFGKTGVFAFDMKGKQLWHTSVGTKLHTFGFGGRGMGGGWGSGASPVLYKDLVIVPAAIESGSLVALDKKSGKEVWRAKNQGTSWASPLLVKTKDGKDEVVVSIPGRVVGYAPQTGEELWYCQGVGRPGGFGSYTCVTPVARDGVIYVTGGGGQTSFVTLAVRAGGRGDVDKTHVVWRKRVGSSIASPVLIGDYLCWVSGTATWLKLADGETAHRDRLYSSSMEYVSAVAAGDKVFALTRFDGLYVLAANGKFEQLAHNEFAGDRSVCNASPAVSDGRLYIRSNAYLYCIGKK